MKFLLLAAMSVAGWGQCEKDRISDCVAGGGIISTVPASVQIANNGKLVLSISKDGDITFGEGVKPSEAAKELAHYLKQYMASDCKPEPKAAAGEWIKVPSSDYSYWNAQERPAYRPPSGVLAYSQASFAAATVADVLSSRGGIEANPLLGRGPFGARQATISLGITGAWLLAQRPIVKRWPSTRRAFEWLNFGGTGAHAFAAIRNLQ